MTCRKTTNKSLLHESGDIDLAICSSTLSCFLATSHIEKMKFLHYLFCTDEYLDIRLYFLEHSDEIQSHIVPQALIKWCREINPFTWFWRKTKHFKLHYCFDVRKYTNLVFCLIFGKTSLLNILCSLDTFQSPPSFYLLS